MTRDILVLFHRVNFNFIFMHICIVQLIDLWLIIYIRACREMCTLWSWANDVVGCPCVDLDWTLPQGSLKAVVYTVARLGAAELREHGQDSGERAGHARQTPPLQLGHVAAGRQVAPPVRTAWTELVSLHVWCVLLGLRVKSCLRTTNLFDNITPLNVGGIILYGGMVILFQSCSSDMCVNCLACVGIGERGLQTLWEVSILARSSREMSLTVHIVWQYILSRVRVSVRPSNFYMRKTLINYHESRPLRIWLLNGPAARPVTMHSATITVELPATRRCVDTTAVIL